MEATDINIKNWKSLIKPGKLDIKLSAIPVKIAMKLQIIENFHIKLPHLYFYLFVEVFQLLLT